MIDIDVQVVETASFPEIVKSSRQSVIYYDRSWRLPKFANLL